jgi:hypothetical protein
VIVALGAVVEITRERPLSHASVVTIAVTLFNKAVQVWEQVLSDKVARLLDQLKQQLKSQLVAGIQLQSLDIYNGNSRTVKGIKRNQ